MENNDQAGVFEQVHNFLTGVHPQIYLYLLMSAFLLVGGYILLKFLFRGLGFLISKVFSFCFDVIDRVAIMLGLSRKGSALFILALPVLLPLVVIYVILKPLLKNVFYLVVGVFRIAGNVISIGKGNESTGRMRSQEIGAEARRIAVREFNVPERFYNNCVVSDFDEIKNAALEVKNKNSEFENYSWPRMLAVVVYGEFRHDCQQYQMGNPIQEQRFITLGIKPEEIFEELGREPLDVVRG